MCNKSLSVVRDGPRQILYSTQNAFPAEEHITIGFRTSNTAQQAAALLGILVAAVAFASCATTAERAQPAAQPAAQPVEPAPPVEPEPPTPAISREEMVAETYSSIGHLVSIGDAEEAIAAYEKAQLSGPDEPETQALLANLYLFAGRTAEATEILDSILEIEPTNPDALYARALVAASSGDRELQTELLERLVDSHPDHADGHAGLGELMLERRRYKEAQEAFEASLAIDEENFVALVGLGNLHLRQDRPERAEEVLTKAIDISPDYAFAYADRGKARAIQQEFARAEADLDTAVGLDPTYSFNYFDRGRVRLERRRFAEAVEDFTRAIDLAPDVFMSYVYRARAFAGLERHALAVEDYETALSMRPDYAPAYGPLGTLYVVEDRPLEAARQFQRAFEDDSRRSWFALLAALALKEGGAANEATKYLERVASEIPRDSLYYEMAKFLLRPGYDAQIRQLVLDEENDLLRAQLLFYLGWQYELNGSPASARAAYLETLDAQAAGLAEVTLARARLAGLVTGDPP